MKPNDEEKKVIFKLNSNLHDKELNTMFSNFELQILFRYILNTRYLIMQLYKRTNDDEIKNILNRTSKIVKEYEISTFADIEV